MTLRVCLPARRPRLPGCLYHLCSVQCRQCHQPSHTAPATPDLTQQDCTASYPAPQNLTFAFLALNTREAAMYSATLDEIARDPSVLPATRLLRRLHVLDNAGTIAAGGSDCAPWRMRPSGSALTAQRSFPFPQSTATKTSTTSGLSLGSGRQP